MPAHRLRALLLGVACAASLTATSTAAADTRACGSGGTVDEVFFLSQVKATNYPCAKAKRFARAFELEGGSTCETEVRCTFRRWSCRVRATDDSFLVHRCAKDDGVVRWRTEEG